MHLRICYKATIFPSLWGTFGCWECINFFRDKIPNQVEWVQEIPVILFLMSTNSKSSPILILCIPAGTQYLANSWYNVMVIPRLSNGHPTQVFANCIPTGYGYWSWILDPLGQPTWDPSWYPSLPQYPQYIGIEFLWNGRND